MELSHGAYTGMKHTHTLFAFLFVLFFAYKAILLLLDKNETLDKIRNNKGLKIGMDMVLPTILIILGLTMASSQPEWPKFVYLKLFLALISIPMGIVAMRKKNKYLSIATLLILLSIIVIAYTKTPV